MSDDWDSACGYELVREIETDHPNYRLWEDEEGDIWFYWSGPSDSMKRPICIEHPPTFSMYDHLRRELDKTGGCDE